MGLSGVYTFTLLLNIPAKRPAGASYNIAKVLLRACLEQHRPTL